MSRISIRRVRKITAKDIEPMILPVDPWKTLGTTQADVRKMARTMSEERYVLGAFDGRRLIGFASLQMGVLGGGYLQGLAVHPGFQGQGIGKLLMKHAERTVFAKYKNFYLCVSSFNRKAIAFYRSLGFERAGVLKKLIVAEYDEHLYRKTTGPFRKERK